jgi:hypothetical protein
LGVGFAFVGSQHRLQSGGEEFFIDLLFYHLKLRAYIVIDLKVQAFRAEFAGKMNFHPVGCERSAAAPGQSAEHRSHSLQNEGPCRSGIFPARCSKPIGVSEYQLAAALPENWKGTLPTIEEIESELSHSSEKGKEE